MAAMITYLLLMVYTIVVVVVGFAVTKRTCEKCAREQAEKARTMPILNSLSEPADAGTTAHMLAIAEGCLDRLVETQGPGVLQDQRLWGRIRSMGHLIEAVEVVVGDPPKLDTSVSGALASDWEQTGADVGLVIRKLMGEGA